VRLVHPVIEHIQGESGECLPFVRDRLTCIFKRSLERLGQNISHAQLLYEIDDIVQRLQALQIVINDHSIVEETKTIVKQNAARGDGDNEKPGNTIIVFGNIHNTIDASTKVHDNSQGHCHFDINIKYEENQVGDSYTTNNQVQAGMMLGNEIGTIKPQKTEQTSVSFDEFEKELSKFLNELLDELKDATKTGFSDDDIEDMRDRISKIEKHLQSQSPNIGLIRSWLDFLKQYLVGVAGSLSANVLWAKYITRIDEIKSLVIQ